MWGLRPGRPPQLLRLPLCRTSPDETAPEAPAATREKVRSRFHGSHDLIHRLFVCISGARAGPGAGAGTPAVGTPAVRGSGSLVCVVPADVGGVGFPALCHVIVPKPVCPGERRA